MDFDVNNSISLLSHIHSKSAEFLQKKLTMCGFTNFASSHGNILFQLSRVESMKMHELSKIINRDKSTTTVLVRKLEKEGFVETVPSAEDKRIKIISLTEKGKQYNALTEKISSELRDICWANFSAEEKNELLSLLLKMKGNLDSESSHPHVNQ